jgi:hypothetical protein
MSRDNGEQISPDIDIPETESRPNAMANWFCNAYGKCGDDCLIFGCAFEEAQEARNWTPDASEDID